MGSCCVYRPSSCVVRRASTIYLNIFSSETTGQNLTKLHQKHPLGRGNKRYRTEFRFHHYSSNVYQVMNLWPYWPSVIISLGRVFSFFKNKFFNRYWAIFPMARSIVFFPNFGEKFPISNKTKFLKISGY